MIECSNIHFHYNNKKSGFQIQDITLQIEPGYFTCLLGHNGAGKTTFLKLLYGMLMPGSGDVMFDGEDVLSEKQYDGKDVASPNFYTGRKREKLTLENLDAYHQICAYVGEEWCIPFLSVKDNVDTLSVLYPEFDHELYEELSRKLDFSEPDTLYFRLSTGQQMKVQLCFQLARRPKYIILDEPLANLDVVAKRDIIEVLQQGINEWDIGVLMSTHLLDEISDVVDYIAAIENGRLCEYGERDEIFEKHDADSLRDVMHGTDGNV